MKQCPQCKQRYPNESATCFADGMTLISLSDARLGTTLVGKYLVEDVVGEGGMSTVYKARNLLIGRSCAVKVMHASIADNQVLRERFRREASAAQKLAHPNIIQIYDTDETDDGAVFIVMELLEGEPLNKMIAEGTLPLERALGIMIQIARALARAHDFAVMHRDLKPDNVFVCHDDVGQSDLVKLLDFGIARSLGDTRLTNAGEVFGTPQYMAPERITGSEAGPAADLYALGVIYFEILSGRLPFESRDIPGYFVKHLREPPPKLRTVVHDAPMALEVLIDELLAKDPKRRPVDAHAVHKRLVDLCGEIGIMPPRELLDDVPSARLSLTSFPQAAAQTWLGRVNLFERMLQTAFPGAPPAELVGLLKRIRTSVARLQKLREDSAAEQQRLEALSTQQREALHRFGNAMDTLGLDASAARDALRAAEVSLSDVNGRVGIAIDEFRECHRSILTWEGRSAFQEPYLELAEAYRLGAEKVEQWFVARGEQREVERELSERRQGVSDLEFQIHEIREALLKIEQQSQIDKHSRESTIVALQDEMQRTESLLIELANQLCGPLQGTPSLAPLFEELHGRGAA